MADPKPTEIGWKARDFALQGVDGKSYRLAARIRPSVSPRQSPSSAILSLMS